MNNTHKLLLAFIKASGYEVERVAIMAKDSDKIVNDYKVTKRQSGNFPVGRKPAPPNLPTVQELNNEFKKDHQL